MHYLKGRHRWVIAVAVGIVLIAVAIVTQISYQELVPLAPGPLPTPPTVGSL